MSAILYTTAVMVFYLRNEFILDSSCFINCIKIIIFLISIEMLASILGSLVFIELLFNIITSKLCKIDVRVFVLNLN